MKSRVVDPSVEARVVKTKQELSGRLEKPPLFTFTLFPLFLFFSPFASFDFSTFLRTRFLLEFGVLLARGCRVMEDEHTQQKPVLGYQIVGLR